MGVLWRKRSETLNRAGLWSPCYMKTTKSVRRILPGYPSCQDRSATDSEMEARGIIRFVKNRTAGTTTFSTWSITHQINWKQNHLRNVDSDIYRKLPKTVFETFVAYDVIREIGDLFNKIKTTRSERIENFLLKKIANTHHTSTLNGIF